MSSRSRQIARVFAKRSLLAVRASYFGLASRDRRRSAFSRQARLACEELGPAYIKIGQLISVRPDLFWPELVFEMETLQDSVAPVPFDRILSTIRTEFGREPDGLFDSIDPIPIASASIAQVHRAKLARPYDPVIGATMPAGQDVVLKVVKPGVARAIEADLAVARKWAGRLSRITEARGIDVLGFLSEFERSLRSETDLRNEGRVADRFAFDFRDDPVLLVPRIVWTRSTRSVLTMEYVEGWRLSEMGEVERAGVDGYGLAVHGAEVFMRQVLVHGRYHADLHPANLFVTPDSRICYLDFGIIGRTEPSERVAIAQVLAATVYGDAERAIRYSRELGMVIDEQAAEVLVKDVDVLFRRTMAPPGADIRGFAMGFLRLLARHRVAIPEGYGMLIKALVTVEGVARALYPEIDISQAAKPFATRLIAREMMRPDRLAERMPEAMKAATRILAG